MQDGRKINYSIYFKKLLMKLMNRTEAAVLKFIIFKFYFNYFKTAAAIVVYTS